MGKAYSNYYYDHLYSESDNSSIGVKISGLLRSKIVNNDIYTLKGFIEKRIKNSSIELVFVVDDIISQEEKTISEEDLKRYKNLYNIDYQDPSNFDLFLDTTDLTTDQTNLDADYKTRIASFQKTLCSACPQKSRCRECGFKRLYSQCFPELEYAKN
jgi:cytidylate kinase